MTTHSRAAVIHRHKKHWTDRSALLSLAFAFVFLFASLYINHLATDYVTLRAGAPMQDIILDNIPVVHVDALFNFGTIFIITVLALILLYYPQKISFTVKSIALFVIIRAGFIVLTHIGPPVNDVAINVSQLGQLFTSVSGADLFFSGHTGLTFLFCLTFWNQKFLRYFFLATSVCAAIAVLLGHIHYSIDVASAFFITYGIYCIAVRIFKADYVRFNEA